MSWKVFINGNWQHVASDDELRQWTAAGHVRPDTPLQHATWPAPMPAGGANVLAGAWPSGQQGMGAPAPYGPAPGAPGGQFGPRLQGASTGGGQEVHPGRAIAPNYEGIPRTRSRYPLSQPANRRLL